MSIEAAATPSRSDGVRAWCWRNWFLLAFIGCLAAAWVLPKIGAPRGPLHPEQLKPAIIFAIFLLCGFSLSTRVLGTALIRLRVHAFIQAYSLALIPLIFLLLDLIWTQVGMPTPLRHGLLLLACLPTTISTCVVQTRVAGGDEAVALVNSTVGNLIGIVVTPLLVLALTGRHTDLPTRSIALQLGLMVVLPLIIGQVLRIPFAALITRLRKPAAVATGWLLLLLIYLMFCDTFSSRVPMGGGALVGVAALVAVLYPLLMLLCLTLSSWRWLAMSRSERVAAGICSTQKTAALGVPMLSIIFAGDPMLPLLTLPLLMYHFVQLLVATAVGPSLKRWVEAVARPQSPACS
ncbi:MAG: bile acid:sodium symporter [Planctomycetes bacterium]|nr:bile acid:sodium symporter [Planctomycetota bacterium]